MVIGDRVRLHVDLGQSEAIDLSSNVGVVVGLDLSPSEDFVLVHFDDATVYTSPVKEGEVEVIPGP